MLPSLLSSNSPVELRHITANGCGGPTCRPYRWYQRQTAAPGDRARRVAPVETPDRQESPRDSGASTDRVRALRLDSNESARKLAWRPVVNVPQLVSRKLAERECAVSELSPARNQTRHTEGAARSVWEHDRSMLVRRSSLHPACVQAA
jgi:hypothetical protein